MLKDFIESNNLSDSAEILRFQKPVSSVSDAAARTGISKTHIVKSVLFVNDSLDAVLVILLGINRVSLKKIESLSGFSKLRLATSDEVFDITGYRVGGVPPISIYGIKTIVDEKVFVLDKIVCGGGDEFSLLVISPSVLEDSIDPEFILIGDVCE
jgi:prolyl-tRNA editing enzyme YbaK/EbsC (Cys-tRNA(Pro) deacylase)